jgi:hypothetical protein
MHKNNYGSSWANQETYQAVQQSERGEELAMKNMQANPKFPQPLLVVPVGKKLKVTFLIYLRF